MQLKELIDYLESVAPFAYQEDYDNSGLLIGNPLKQISKALISLDCTEEVLAEAEREGADLIISHHPLIFSGIKKLTGQGYTERIVEQAIRKDIAVYAIHTNLDNIAKGVNSKICEKLELINTSILKPREDLLHKLITFCPKDKAGQIRKAMFDAGAGQIGNYSECSFNTEGFGTFKAGEDTNAYVGEKGKQHTENEIKIEVAFPYYLKNKLLAALFKAHPYEEVAYDVVPVSISHSQVGSGMIGNLKTAMNPHDFLSFIKEKMESECIKYTRINREQVKRIAVCGGSGSFLLKNAISAGADVFISADFKYHQYFDADGKIIIADIGHFETEQFTQELLYEIIRKKFPTFALYLTKINTNPVNYLF